MTLWMLSHIDTFFSVGDRFGLAASSTCAYFYETVREIAKTISQHICMPNASERQRIANEFQRQSRIPMIVGAIDGCHIRILQPPNNSTDYYNRKGFHSIILQGVCDDNMRFIDIFVGRPGRMHDANVFSTSPIYNRLFDTTNPLLPTEQHIMGDNAYPNSNFVITPFRDNGHLTSQQISFNIRLSSVRQVIERAFGRLKGKFRKLKMLDVTTVEHANLIIAACCVLHNFTLNENIAHAYDGADDDGDDDNVDGDSDNALNQTNDYNEEEMLFSETIETDKRLLFTNSM